MSGETESSKRCEICSTSEAKYRCPKCQQRTCSLVCVNKHKQEKSCDGVRDKTKYVRVKEFTDMNLLSDYRFLEDGGRKAYSAEKDMSSKKRNLNHKAHFLQKMCNKRGIKLRLMPYPMSKRKNNRSFAQKQANSITWHVEWIFPHSEVKYFDKVLEKDTLEKSLCNFIHPEDSDPVKRQRLKMYVHKGMEEAMILMKMEDTPANNTRFHVLDKTKTLNENLQGKIVVEYPTLHVVLSDKLENYNFAEPEGTQMETGSSSGTSDTDSSSSESSSSSDESGDKNKEKVTHGPEQINETSEKSTEEKPLDVQCDDPEIKTLNTIDGSQETKSIAVDSSNEPADVDKEDGELSD